MTIISNLAQWCPVSIQEVNYPLIPVTSYDPLNAVNGEEQLDKANLLLTELRKKAQEDVFMRTKKGGLRKHISNMRSIFEITRMRLKGYEILAHVANLGWARIQIRVQNSIEKVGESRISGREALKKLMKALPELEQYVCDNEESNLYYRNEAKKFYDTNSVELGESFLGIPASMYDLSRNKELNHIWSLDFHWAFPSALAEIIPSTYDKLNELYQKRKTNEVIKAIGVEAVGMMCSEFTTYMGLPKMALAELRYCILNYHNQKLHYIARELEKQGGRVINFRTDSIKFLWTKPYEPQLPWQGPGLCQWDYEFKNARYRQKSTGCYEYEVNGVYKAVVNGLTRLDRIKPRDQWQWGDIMNDYNMKILAFVYDAETRKFIYKEA